ncbi:MAG: hypothetical protein CVV64_18215 [Candidatus Wallbacteria bacterium HGW-Wallbacteria-1]|jgi:iron-only hydrogenase group A|uniref:Ferredoxin n=1 Tax=Candidatus Wallbacteria bacterium HGW-Wallbacteria-1 TaxID=2013854 RepID=A0A2N1PJS0_9BACT|nr:MAG: hypothetical protein CVV64_18215 [Candidatus Wallbacteria bacterium HGW-Wallbacteria-1]
MKEVSVNINGIDVKVPEGVTILEAANRIDVHIPTLCDHPDLKPEGSCRICVVEIEGQRVLQPACAFPCSDGLKIKTYTEKVRKARKMNIELLLADHYGDCQTCVRNMNCELQTLAYEYNVNSDNMRFPKVNERRFNLDLANPAIQRDPDKCIMCRRCVRVCGEIQKVSALHVVERGPWSIVQPSCERELAKSECISCGQCINRCPTGALYETDAIQAVWKALDDPTKHVVAQEAPAIRAALAEACGYEPGILATGQMYSALRMLGFDKVFDTNFTADLTIMEEGTELLTRLKKALVDKDTETALPMITSCSPGWIQYLEKFYAEFIPNVSTCKSPQQMFGAVVKSYYAEKAGIDPRDVVCVSIMPCTAKKYECQRPEMYSSGTQDVDYVLTTRELARMIKQTGLNLMDLPAGQVDELIGVGSGAADIFANTGGVMEAALRTAYEIVTGREVPFTNLEITPVRGMDGIKVAEVKVENVVADWKFLEGATLKVAIAHSTGAAMELLNKVKSGEIEVHFIEVMGCPGGCIGGGGQPKPTNMVIRKKRAQAIYNEDSGKSLRKSHENVMVKKIYEDYFGAPNSHKAHKLLHTHYTPRSRYTR